MRSFSLHGFERSIKMENSKRTYNGFIAACQQVIEEKATPRSVGLALQDLVRLVRDGEVKAVQVAWLFVVSHSPRGCNIPTFLPDYPVVVQEVNASEVLQALTSADMVAEPATSEARSRVFEIDFGSELEKRMPELTPHLMAGWRCFVMTHL